MKRRVARREADTPQATRAGREDAFAPPGEEGAPSSETFPIEELAEIAARVIRSRGQFALQYGPTRGQQSLLEAIAEMLAGRGIIARPGGGYRYFAVIVSHHIAGSGAAVQAIDTVVREIAR